VVWRSQAARSGRGSLDAAGLDGPASRAGAADAAHRAPAGGPQIYPARDAGAPASSSRDVADYLAARGLFRTPDFAVTRFVLYSSRASTGGGPYVVEQGYPLLTSP